jgi:RNA polymerase sigma-70 factor (ECF subfamily)
MAKTSAHLYMELLVLRSQKGEVKAFEELITLWTPRLHGYVRRLCEHDADADDVVQETWFAAVRGLNKLEFVGAFPTWLFRIATTKWADCLRLKMKLKSGDEEALRELPEEDAETVMGDLIRRETAERVAGMMRKLSPPHRAVLSLHYFEGFSTDAIGEILGIPEGTVKSRLYHARLYFKKHWEEERHE